MLTGTLRFQREADGEPTNVNIQKHFDLLMQFLLTRELLQNKPHKFVCWGGRKIKPGKRFF